MSAKYRTIAPLACGGMGRINLAIAVEPPGFERLVVLKRVRIDGSAEEREENERALVWEATLAGRLVHPNVVVTVDLHSEGDDLVVVLEYIEGVTVRELLAAAAVRRVRLPESIALRIACDALEGLHYVHDFRDPDGTCLEIVHRDISPANLLVALTGTAKVLDFGIAKAKTSTYETPLGFTKGKLRYMAPEQLVGGPVDRRADIFAMGVVLWEAVTGTPFGGDSPEATMGDRLSDACPRVSTVFPVSPLLDQIIARCLRRAPKDRFATAAELASALHLYARMRGGLATHLQVGELVHREFEARFVSRRLVVRDAYARTARPRWTARTSQETQRTQATQATQETQEMKVTAERRAAPVTPLRATPARVTPRFATGPSFRRLAFASAASALVGALISFLAR